MKGLSYCKTVYHDTFGSNTYDAESLCSLNCFMRKISVECLSDEHEKSSYGGDHLDKEEKMIEQN